MDPEIKKRVLRKLTYGMWIMSASAGGELEASTVTWLTQVSFVPPLVVVGVRAGTHLHEVAEKSGSFALHLITEDQKELAERFIKPTEIVDGRIGGYGYRPGPVTGSPLLDGFPAWLEARVVEIVKRGDHSAFVAEVVGAGETDADARPLLLATTGWHYGG